jgi:hypothetical protein
MAASVAAGAASCTEPTVIGGPRVQIPCGRAHDDAGCISKMVGTPLLGLEASATVDALWAICELGLSRAIIPATIRETRSHPGGAASISDRVCVFQT